MICAQALAKAKCLNAYIVLEVFVYFGFRKISNNIGTGYENLFFVILKIFWDYSL